MIQSRRVVITGIGVVSPAGRGEVEFFDNLLEGRDFVKEIDHFDASLYPARHAGRVERLDDEVFSKRLIKKLDRFSHLALVASDDAINSSRLDLKTCDMERIGIVLGNALGGWGFAEVELRDLYQQGLREVSPYQATAWFPAAPQGQVSIHCGIKGFAKTIISDTASSLLALGYAARAVKTGKADVILAGGVEAPLTPYALLCCNTSGEMSVSGRYRPFDRDRDGYVIAEGAAVLVVEEYEHAVARGAKVYAEVSGFSHTSDGVHPTDPDPEGRGIARAMQAALDAAGLKASEIDYLLPAGLGGIKSDKGEALAINSIFAASLGNGLSVGVPKSLYGNALGASGALDAATALIAMERGTAPTHTGCGTPDEGCGWVNGSGMVVEKDIRTALINSVGRGGVNTSIVLRKQ